MVWLFVVGLLVWAMRSGIQTPKGYMILGGAALVVLLIFVGKATNGIFFWPASRPTAAAAFQPLPEVLYGRVYGDIRASRSDFFGVEVPAVARGLRVQVRWLDAATPPHLALLAPSEIPTHLKHPTVEADAWSLWFTGSSTRTGWVWASGRKFYGLELAFLGRRTFLDLDDVDAIEQVEASLQA